MGICAQKELEGYDGQQLKKDNKKNKQIEKELAVDQKKDRGVNKLLLLGAGQSGKSTLFKQMYILYVEGFDENERQLYTSPVHSNVVLSMKTLCEYSDILGEKDKEFLVDDKLTGAKDTVNTWTEEDTLKPEWAKIIVDLWKDNGIQKTYQNRSKFQLNDSTAYFFDRIHAICTPDYVPSEQDVLRTRVPTTGIVENKFVVEGNVFKMFDVGGQRSERKKWIHCFEDVTAVLFIAAISAYDLVLYEEESTNRMSESLELFKTICTNKWFDSTAVILFLNKSDIFRQKIEIVPLEKHFPDYKPAGVDSKYDEAVDFIVEMFESRGVDGDKSVYTHVTVATDSENVFIVFNAVKDIIIKQGLERAGLT